MMIRLVIQAIKEKIDACMRRIWVENWACMSFPTRCLKRKKAQTNFRMVSRGNLLVDLTEPKKYPRRGHEPGLSSRAGQKSRHLRWLGECGYRVPASWVIPALLGAGLHPER